MGKLGRHQEGFSTRRNGQKKNPLLKKSMPKVVSRARSAHEK
jgi:hypothetical protein